MRPLALVVVALMGCRDIPPDARLTDLDEEQSRLLCEQHAENARTLRCGGDPIDLPGTDIDACVDYLTAIPVTCQATADDYKQCQKARKADDSCEPSTELLPDCAWQYEDSCYRSF